MTCIDVCIATWQRPSLATTLRSIEAQDLPDSVSVRIIVADNDETPSAKALVDEVAASMTTPVTYLHAPSRNISLARNACLDAATAEWVAFLDDDEVADPDWLAKLLEAVETGNMTAVFGPGIAEYAADMPHWMRARDYHSNYPQTRGGIVETGHTCNALVRREDPAVVGKRFDLAKGLTGGEDTDYFFRIGQDGGCFAITDEAIVHEPVDAGRASYGWIARRKFRSGQSFGQGAAAGQAGSHGVILMAMLKVVFSATAAAVFFWSETRRNYWSLRAIFHGGVVASAFGVKEQELY